LKQIQTFLSDFANNKNPAEFKGEIDRKTKIVRIMANLFLQNFKMFLLCPVLCHADPALNKYFLDMIENLGNSGTIIEAAPPIPKKDAKFVYFSVFAMKNQSSRLFMKKSKDLKLGKRIKNTIDYDTDSKSLEKSIQSDPEDNINEQFSVFFPIFHTVKEEKSPPRINLLNPPKSKNYARLIKNKNSRKLTSSTIENPGVSISESIKPQKFRNVSMSTKNIKTPGISSTKLEPYQQKIEKVQNAQSMQIINNLEEKYEFDAQSKLRKRFPISKNADQVMDELNNKILELELENKKVKYIFKNMAKDAENKLAFANQKLQLFESNSPYSELFEQYNKEIRKYEKQIEFIRNSFVDTISAHEIAYNSMLNQENIGKKDKVLLNEMRVLQRNNRKFLVDLKTKELELNALKSKEKVWIGEHKELDDLKKDADKVKRNLAKSENAIQSNEVTIQGSEKALLHLRSQYEALDAKNRENEKLILTLQGQIDRLTVKLQSVKVMNKLDQPIKLPKLQASPDAPAEFMNRKIDDQKFEHIPLTVDKGQLVKTHTQIKQCKTQIADNLLIIRNETQGYANANLYSATDSLERNTALIFKIVGDLEMRELNYLNTISQVTGSSPLKGKY